MLAIRSLREEVTDRFSVLSFLVRTDGLPYFEVALATEPGLLTPARKAERTTQNFYSSRDAGPLPAERGEAVYMVPLDVLQRFAGYPRLYYGLAVFAKPGQDTPDAVKIPTEESHWIGLGSFSGRRLRRMRLMHGAGLTGPSRGYAGRNGSSLTWAGDVPRPGMEAEKPEPAISITPKPGNGNAAAKPDSGDAATAEPVATNGEATKEAASLAYDDGFGPMPAPLTAAEEDALHGIEAPIPDVEPTAAQAMYARPMATPDYPQADRFIPAHSSNYRKGTAGRKISRIVIHITDGGANINGTISWFQNPSANVSSHYIVGQDGEVVQMVAHDDVAWHARSANSDSIGIEHVANTKGLVPTEAQYCASAALVSWLCDKYGIPEDRSHIQGHSEADPKTSHTGCPNAVWDWDYYMGMVTSRTCYPRSKAQAWSLAETGTPPPAAETGLQSGDLILIPGGISAVTAGLQAGSTATHRAVMVTGDGMVIDAGTGKVEEKPLLATLLDQQEALILRHSHITPEAGGRMRDFARSMVGQASPRWADVRYSFQDPRPLEAATGPGQSFLCPEVVLAAYQHGGISLTVEVASWNGGSLCPLLQLSPDMLPIGKASLPAKQPAAPGTDAAPAPEGNQAPAPAMAQPMRVVDLVYTPTNPDEAKKALADFLSRKQRWGAGVSNTTFMPHSAICHLELKFDDGKTYYGTGFYISHDRILTAGHNVVDKKTGSRATKIHVIPGKNGKGNEPFGRFTVKGDDCVPHPRYDGGRDFDLAVLKVSKAPPHGNYFEVLEDLDMSIEDVMIVCGYAAATVDPHKQHLDGDTIRDVADNMETFKYNLQTEGGSSGSPVFYVTGYDDPLREQCVMEERVIGVHVSASTTTLNKGCRLTRDKIAWINSVGTPGEAASFGAYAAPAGRVARPMQTVEIASAVAGAVMSRVLDNKGDISWELDQMRGLKHPFNDKSYENVATFKDRTLPIKGPRMRHASGLDHLYADMEISYQYNGHSLGNVQIAVTEANDAVFGGLSVKAQIMDDANTYKEKNGDGKGFAALKVRIQYRFTHTVLSDVICFTDIVLYGKEGKYSMTHRWPA